MTQQQQELSVEGKTVARLREQSRKALAITLARIFAVVLIGTIAIATILIWFEKLTFDNALTLILAVISAFSGLIGSAMTFYFSVEK